jgi:hypothetical protein
MKVRELIEQLQACDPDREVVMARDSEGNGYSPLADFWSGRYRAETTWSGEVGMETLTDAEMDAGYGIDDIMTDGVAAIILCPTN